MDLVNSANARSSIPGLLEPLGDNDDDDGQATFDFD
jgi:hypothetical protein